MIHGLCDVFFPVDFVCINIRGNKHKLIKKFCHSNVIKYFFNNRVVDTWNSLTNEIITLPSVSIFKKTIIYQYNSFSCYYGIIFVFICFHLGFMFILELLCS